MDKLKKFFSEAFSDNDPATFKGQGRKLGSGDPNSTKPTPAELRAAAETGRQQQARQAPRPTGAQPSQPLARSADRNQTLGATGGAPTTTSPSAALNQAAAMAPAIAPGTQTPGGPLSPSAANVQRVGLEDLVISNSPTGCELEKLNGSRGFIEQKQALGEEDRRNSSHDDLANLRPATHATISDPTRQESRLGMAVHPARDEDTDAFAMQHSLALVLSHPSHGTSLSTLARIMSNILAQPFEPKYRQIRLSNPKVQEELVAVSGAVEFLEAVGFEFKFEDGAAGASSQGFAVLPETAPLGSLETGWQELCQVMQAHGIPLPGPTPAAAQAAEAALAAAAAAAHGAGAAPRAGPPSTVTFSAPIERNTQVILPVAPDTQVPDWFFERTGAEVKAEYQRLTRDRDQAGQLMTRAWRERLAAGGSSGASAAQATVRVRFPEGVCLQGCFAAGEPCSAVYAWVSSALRSEAITYELMDPSRRAVERGSRVREAGLAPSCLLNFRATGDSASAFVNTPFLSDHMLRQTQAMY